jgi:haloacid dehalogenase-like hydrolase
MTSSRNETAGAGSLVLCVDMDGCILRTDTLIEGILTILRRSLSSVFMIFAWLLQGRASLKERVATDADLDPATLPYDQTVLKYLRQQRAAGRNIALVTAGEQRVAAMIADHLGLFDSVIASDGKTNLKGERKRYELVRRFGRGAFDYIGNSVTDIPIFEEAASAIYGGQSFLLRLRIALTPGLNVSALDEQSSLLSESVMLPLLRAFRPEQWSVALFVFLPLLLSRQAREMKVPTDAILAVLSCALMTSSACLIGDLLNINRDRCDLTLSNKPLTSGAVAPIAAINSICVSSVAGGLIALTLDRDVLAVLPAYLMLGAVYYTARGTPSPTRLIMRIGLYAMVAFVGEIAFRVAISPWLTILAVSLFAALTSTRSRHQSF